MISRKLIVAHEDSMACLVQLVCFRQVDTQEYVIGRRNELKCTLNSPNEHTEGSIIKYIEFVRKHHAARITYVKMP
jgi:hypothetical protein